MTLGHASAIKRAVKLRRIASIALFMLGIVLVVVTVVQNGAPWGFRGHRAVLARTDGTFEITLSEARRTREGLEEGPLTAPEAGMFLDTRDELRVGRFSEVELRMVEGTVRAKDDARVIFAEGSGLALQKGLIDIDVKPGKVLVLHAEAWGFDVKLLPGHYRAVTDGSKEFRVVPVQGSVEWRGDGGELFADPGHVFVMARPKPRVDVVARDFNISGTCDGKQLSLKTTPGAQVFLPGVVVYAGSDGALNVAVPAGAPEPVPAVARDATLRIARAAVDCRGEPPAPPPPAP